MSPTVRVAAYPRRPRSTRPDRADHHGPSMRRAGNCAGNPCDSCHSMRSMRGSFAGNKGFCVRASTLTRWMSTWSGIKCGPKPPRSERRSGCRPRLASAAARSGAWCVVCSFPATEAKCSRDEAERAKTLGCVCGQIIATVRASLEFGHAWAPSRLAGGSSCFVLRKLRENLSGLEIRSSRRQAESRLLLILRRRH